MRKILLGLTALIAVLATLGLTTGSANAANPGGGTTKCTGDLTAEVENNLVVPAGATCSLWGAQTIKGNVTVEAGATLISYQQTMFDGERDRQRWHTSWSSTGRSRSRRT